MSERVKGIDQEVHELFKTIDSDLKSNSHSVRAEQMENYMKGVTFKYYGLQTPLIQSVFNKLHDK